MEKGQHELRQAREGKNQLSREGHDEKKPPEQGCGQSFLSSKRRIKSESLPEWSRGKTNCPELSRSTAKCPEQDWGKLDEPGGAGAKVASSSGAGITPSCLVGAGAILTARRAGTRDYTRCREWGQPKAT